MSTGGHDDHTFAYNQALYGRIYGLYTRFQLTKSLAEKKEHNLRLVEKVDELAGKLRKMEVCKCAHADKAG